MNNEIKIPLTLDNYDEVVEKLENIKKLLEEINNLIIEVKVG